MVPRNISQWTLALLWLLSPTATVGFQQQQQQQWKTKSSTKLYSSTLPKEATETSSTAEVATQNVFGSVSDAVTGGIFSLLHLQDETGIQDASKNLRVLWARALLHAAGKVNDEVARELLPPNTRGLVASPQGASLFQGSVKFLEWIQARTEFIDSAVDAFLSSPACQSPNGHSQDCQVRHVIFCYVSLVGRLGQKENELDCRVASTHFFCSSRHFIVLLAQFKLFYV
jgi:hypothetical protein